MLFAIATFPGQPDKTALFGKVSQPIGNLTYAIDLGDLPRPADRYHAPRVRERGRRRRRHLRRLAGRSRLRLRARPHGAAGPGPGRRRRSRGQLPGRSPTRISATPISTATETSATAISTTTTPWAPPISPPSSQAYLKGQGGPGLRPRYRSGRERGGDAHGLRAVQPDVPRPSGALGTRLRRESPLSVSDLGRCASAALPSALAPATGEPMTRSPARACPSVPRCAAPK